MSEQNGSPQSAPRTLARDVGGFAHDVLTLAELQAELFAADVRECGERVVVPGFVLLSGLALGFACFPIVLTALALLLIQAFEISYAAGFLAAFVVGAVLSALLCVLGWLRVRRHVALLGRSKLELACNLHWIKKVLERNRVTRINRVDNSWRTVI